jgi:KUP system potassium uptake protein
MLIISIKYVAIVMRADNNGEGGIMALLALNLRKAKLPITKKLLDCDWLYWGITIFW